MVSPGPFPQEPRQIIGGTLIVLGVIAGFAVASFLCDVLFLLFIGMVLATALKPIIDAIQRCGIRQPVAVGAVYAFIILLLVVVIIVGVPPLINLCRELMSEIPLAVEQSRQWLASAGDVFWANVARRLAVGLSFGSGPVELEQSLATVSRTASYLAMLANGLLAASVVVLLAFYWSLQGDRTIRWLLLLLPVTRRDGARDTISEIEGKVGAYLRGQGLVCLAMAGMAAVVYSLLGLRYAIVLALVAGLLEVMPVLGPILGTLPPLGVALFTDPRKATWVLVAAVLMQQSESYLIVPRIMDKSVGVHPLVTLLAIAAFGSLLGIGGAILAIPLAAIVQVILNRYVLGSVAVDRGAPNGRGALSVLQYDTQRLLCDILLRGNAEPPAGKVDHLAEAIEAIARDLDAELKEVESQGEAEDKQ
ncbi:MAG: AI-2E family transporter [Thermoguttaceae bacterium]|jgi:predicted PurR-regulated permease PerM